MSNETIYGIVQLVWLFFGFVGFIAALPLITIAIDVVDYLRGRK